MRMTDRAAFEQYAQSQGCNDFEYDQDDGQRYRNPFTQREYKYWRAALEWQAAAEAAKATGTAGELPPLPSHPEVQVMRWSELEQKAIREYGQACANAALAKVYAIAVEEKAKMDAEPARQPAAVVAVKTWKQRLEDLGADIGDGIDMDHPIIKAMKTEIADLRAALAARSQP